MSLGRWPVQQPAIPLDKKTPPLLAMSPVLALTALPPSYPSMFSPYTQPRGPSVPRLFVGQPLQQPPFCKPWIFIAWTGVFDDDASTTWTYGQFFLTVIRQSSSIATNADLVRNTKQRNLLSARTMGSHARQTKYGVLGIISAIIFFPFGLLCLLRILP
ncbi:hypothetical protein E4T56_gene5195 [Termitomyces sp. T112]|nr:hypothetical protein E4T56_gene5195 [Termitomyces sp. T112]